jgi:hypothetical protein
VTIADQLQRALVRQADAISLPAADPDAVVRRGSRRRARRRAAIAGIAVLAIGAMSVSVVQRGDKDATVESALAASVVASPFDWTVVSPESGLGYSASSAELDGAVYRLSTAPGPADPNAASVEQRLYRSDDGAEWAEVALPVGMKTSSLAASDGALYAVGTAPAGGGTRDLVVATSTDGAATWANVTLPADVADLEARFPGQVVIGSPQVAAQDATHLVASVVVTATPDVAALLPGVADPEAGWSTSREGVTLFELVPCADGNDGCRVDSTGRAVPAAEANGATSTTAPDSGKPQPMMPQAGASYTWDQLGVAPELQELISGRTYVYASDDGSTFTRVDLPAGSGGSGSNLLAAADGYRLFVGSQVGDVTSTRVLQSNDGHTWTDTGSLPGWPQTSGLLGGRPAVALFGDKSLSLQVLQPGGTWVPLDLAQAVTSAVGVGEIVFGPLGLAATVWTDDPNAAYLVHSVDGSSLSVVALADYVDLDPIGVLGIDVSADAITVRIGGPSDDDPSTLTPQQVLVGTPR